MTNVVSLKPTKPCEDVVTALRRIADDIEREGEPISTAVVLLGHVGAEKPDDEGNYSEEIWWRSYGVGPRNDTFTVRGLIATCLNRWNPD